MRHTRTVGGGRGCPTSGSIVARRKVNDERCPLAGCGLDVDGTVVFLDNPVTDREAETGPLADRLGREEWVEDPFADAGIDAAACVG